MEERIALFDMDGTIADYDFQMRNDLKKLGNELLPDNLHGNVPAWLAERKRIIGSQSGWWRNLPEIKSGMEIMDFCTEVGFRIHILTQGPYHNRIAWGEKFDWCDTHVSPIAPDYVLSVTREGKGGQYGRLFVDDYPPFMEAWLKHRPRGLGLMPINSENKSFSHPQVVKYDVNDWRSPELVERVHGAYNRPSINR